MSLTQQFNGGAYVKLEAGFSVVTTQTSAAAALETTGATVDRYALGAHYYSAKAVVAGKFNGGTTAKTAVLAPVVYHSSDGTSWDSYTSSTGVTFTGTTEVGEVEVDVNLNGARRYVKVNLPAPTFSDCSSGSYFTGAGGFIFTGPDTLPAA